MSYVGKGYVRRLGAYSYVSVSDNGSQFSSVGPISENLSGSSGNWEIELTFDIPSEGTPTGYTVQVQVDGGSFTPVTPDSTSGTTTLTYTFSNLPSGIYRYRIQANYLEGNSSFVVSDNINAFITHDFDSSVRYHTLAIAG